MPYSESSASNAASKFGQMIGEALEKCVIDFINQYLGENHPDYELLPPDTGKVNVTLEMLGGLSRQMDTVISTVTSSDPVALLETKWLKDGRHHNDKGAWILQLREVKKKYPTVRGAAAVVAGFWTESVGLMLLHEGGVRMIILATDDQVYQSLQPYINQYTTLHNLSPLILNTVNMRKSYDRPWDLANMLINMPNDQLANLARSWLSLERSRDDQGNPIYGKDLVASAINELLKPLPANPRVQKYEISLQIDTGNVIHLECTDLEEAREFLETFTNNPDKILKYITPRDRS